MFSSRFKNPNHEKYAFKIKIYQCNCIDTSNNPTIRIISCAIKWYSKWSCIFGWLLMGCESPKLTYHCFDV